MPNDDQALRRAAGVIMWHLEKRHSFTEAVARAQHREPDLTDREIGRAAQWAQSALLFAQLLKNGKDSDDVVYLAYLAGLPVFEDNGDG